MELKDGWLAIAWLVVVTGFLGGVLWILWPWRQIPAMLSALATSDGGPGRTDTPEPPPEAGAWYVTPDMPEEPGKRNVYFPDEPDLREERYG